MIYNAVLRFASMIHVYQMHHKYLHKYKQEEKKITFTKRFRNQCAINPNSHLTKRKELMCELGFRISNVHVK